MEIEKLIRIVAIFIAIATFAIWVTYRLMFPEPSLSMNLSIAIAVTISLAEIWRSSSKKEKSK